MSRRALLAATLFGAACGSRHAATPERRAEVAVRGTEVMPFDLSRTYHVFASLPDGGLQTVRASPLGDTLQVRLIQEHLREEAARFSRGDFSDPMAIHGHTMPGIAELRAGAARIQVEFSARTDGASIRYRTKDPALIAALHRWFEAQRADHGID